MLLPLEPERRSGKTAHRARRKAVAAVVFQMLFRNLARSVLNDEMFVLLLQPAYLAPFQLCLKLVPTPLAVLLTESMP